MQIPEFIPAPVSAHNTSMSYLTTTPTTFTLVNKH